MDLQLQYSPVICFHCFAGNIPDHPGPEALIKIRYSVRQIRLKVDLFLNLPGHIQGDLASVRPVYLIPVKRSRIMRSSDHDARRSLQMPYGKRKHRRRFQRRINGYTDSHICQRSRGHLRKIPAVDPAVIADRAGRMIKMFLQITAQPPCCPDYREYIHPVCTGPENASKSAGSEYQIPVKTVTLLGIIH